MRGPTFVVLLVAAVCIAACGREVTPNPPGQGAGGAPPGYLAVKVDVAGAFNFANYQYWIVFNTSGNGLTPDTTPLTNNWASYSDAIVVSGGGGGTFARAVQIVKQPNVVPTFYPLPGAAQQLQYTPNSNGSGTEFTVLVARSLFAPVVTPKPPATPAPLAGVWLFNAFTTQSNGQVPIFVDSMGPGGPVSPQYTSPRLNVLQCFDAVNYARNSGLQIDPAAQLVSVEIGNNPSAGPC